MGGYLQRLLDTAAVGGPPPATLAPSPRSTSPVFEQNQLLGLGDYDLIVPIRTGTGPDDGAGFATPSAAMRNRTRPIRTTAPWGEGPPETTSRLETALEPPRGWPPPPAPAPVAPVPPGGLHGTDPQADFGLSGSATVVGSRRPPEDVAAEQKTNEASSADPSWEAPPPLWPAPTRPEPVLRLEVAPFSAPRPGHLHEAREGPLQGSDQPDPDLVVHPSLDAASPDRTAPVEPCPTPALAFDPRPAPPPPDRPGPAEPAITIGHIAIEVVPDRRPDPAPPRPLTAAAASVIGPLGQLRMDRRLLALRRL